MTLLSYRSGSGGPAPVSELRDDLDAVLEAVTRALKAKAQDLDDVLAFKQREVEIDQPDLRRLGLHTRERFGELVDQGATFLRLRDALDWVAANARGAVIERCHPSTTAGTRVQSEADLEVLVGDDRFAEAHLRVHSGRASGGVV